MFRRKWWRKASLGTALGTAASARARTHAEAIAPQPVCTITVSPSPEPVYAKTSEGDQVFYVRVNSSTRILQGGDLISYVKHRWR